MLWDEHPAEMAEALARHDVLLREAIESSGGFVFKTVGDAFYAAFATALDGVGAAVAAQRAIGAEPWPVATPIRVRIALHSGTCEERDRDYFGSVLNRAARLEAVAHGGQTIMSAVTAGLVGDTLPDGVTLGDLGEHRLKDLGRPERVFQISAPGLEDQFAPLRSLTNPQLLHNLPQQVSSFVGRERELAEIRKLLDKSRLVTLTGPGGSGKTRLALQVAAELLDGSGDGVWLADLAPLAEAELVATTVAGVLGVREDAGRPMLATLVDAIRDRDLLVVLDNCEHVIDTAAKLADAVLRACPGVELLATSREPLGISGEHAYRVPSLSLPPANETDPETLGGSEAVLLLVERAAQHTPGYTLEPSDAPIAARVCRRLDGIPLAIELAAARLRTLSIDDLDRRLDQRFRLLTGGSAPPSPANRPSKRRSTGPGTCSHPPSRPSSRASPCSPADGTSTLPRRSHPAATSPTSRSSITSARSSTRASSKPTTPPGPSATDSSRPCVNTPIPSSPNAERSRRSGPHIATTTSTSPRPRRHN